MNVQNRHKLFSELIALHQSGLYAYLFAIVQNWQDADDLYQSTCLVLWRKFETFQPDSGFFAWAREIAKREARNFLRRRRSPNYLDQDLADSLAETATDVRSDELEAYLVALRRCRGKLSVTDDELLKLRYAEDLGSRQIADQLERPYRSICNSLNRIRSLLLQCVKKELAQQARSEMRQI